MGYDVELVFEGPFFEARMTTLHIIKIIHKMPLNNIKTDNFSNENLARLLGSEVQTDCNTIMV